MRRIGFAIALLVGVVRPGSASALGPQDVCVLYNKNVPASKSVAEYYAQKRNVPAANLIPLDLVDADEISRPDYETRILAPVRAALKDRRPRARVLLTVYGVPLRVGPQPMNDADKAALAKVEPDLAAVSAEVRQLTASIRLIKADMEKDPESALALLLPDKEKALKEAEHKKATLEARVQSLSHAASGAAVDSELMLLWWPAYDLSRWVINPLYWQLPEVNRLGRPPVMMTSRLDGPTPDIAKRLVDDALKAEATGLSGKVYIDARGIRYDPKADPSGTGYGGYDESFREAAHLLEKSAKMDVVLDNTEELFPVGSCRQCALYCGWYALKNYRACCQFVPGAIAWHLASLEMTTLRPPGKEWAGNLLRDGAAVTIGPVAEPFTVGFPKPEEFFGFLVTGEYTLVECYARTTLLTSWVVALVGDPLYNPYGKTPKLKSWEVTPSPQGSHLFAGQ
jgi:uncharacterized protein (TIGR03790 family)